MILLLLLLAHGCPLLLGHSDRSLRT